MTIELLFYINTFALFYAVVWTRVFTMSFWLRSLFYLSLVQLFDIAHAGDCYIFCSKFFILVAARVEGGLKCLSAEIFFFSITVQFQLGSVQCSAIVPSSFPSNISVTHTHKIIRSTKDTLLCLAHSSPT